MSGCCVINERGICMKIMQLIDIYSNNQFPFFHVRMYQKGKLRKMMKKHDRRRVKCH